MGIMGLKVATVIQFRSLTLMKSSIFAVALAGAAFVATGAMAQDYSASPTSGQVRLSEGFPNDPYTVELIAGGNIDASRLGGACVGSIANAPDFRLTYQTNGNLPLTIVAISDGDTTLVINGPDGRWHCDDDSGGDLNPGVLFQSPQSGVYDIWVGSIGQPVAAVLGITEQAGW